MKSYTLTVLEIRRETEDTVTIGFKQPGLKKIRYKSGQYLTVAFRINGRRYLRPYSFSSTPNIDSNLEITVKRVDGGIVSNHIHDMLHVGDSVEVIEPMGDFVFEASKDISTVYLWGVGSGITPLFSIAKEIIHFQKSIHVNLIYGSKDHNNTIFRDNLEKLLLFAEGRFHLWNFQSKLTLTEKYPFLQKGRIDKDKIVEVISNSDLTKSVHYICGPFGLKESVKEVLTAKNVSNTRIFSEDFELTKDPAEFTDIITRKIKIDFDNIEHDVEILKGKSILECALDAGIEIPYSCQTGDCNTCKGTLTEGTAKMIGLSKMRADLNNDEYLLCCSYPTAENVKIKL
jgi:ring-1,2-phenylacetyl-CoA epoxidase subunit PaaE